MYAQILRINALNGRRGENDVSRTRVIVSIALLTKLISSMGISINEEHYMDLM